MKLLKALCFISLTMTGFGLMVATLAGDWGIDIAAFVFVVFMMAYGKKVYEWAGGFMIDEKEGGAK